MCLWSRNKCFYISLKQMHKSIKFIPWNPATCLSGPSRKSDSFPLLKQQGIEELLVCACLVQCYLSEQPTSANTMNAIQLELSFCPGLDWRWHARERTVIKVNAPPCSHSDLYCASSMSESSMSQFEHAAQTETFDLASKLVCVE